MAVPRAVLLFVDSSDSENEVEVPSSRRRRLAMNTHGQPSTSRSRRGFGAAEATQEGGENVATLEDLDVLNCPICCEPLTSPVYQCTEGHVVCVVCCQKISRCPSCTKPISSIRCRAIERLAESAKFSCVNKQLGCTEKLSNSKKMDHEQKECQYAPAVSCPCCQYVGASRRLYVHFADQHPLSVRPITLNSFTRLAVYENVRQVVLQESVTETLFVLKRFTEPRGTLVTVTCLAHPASDVKFSYELKAETGNNKICLKNLVELTPNGITHPPEKNFLLITNDLHMSTTTRRSVLAISLKIKKLS